MLSLSPRRSSVIALLLGACIAPAHASPVQKIDHGILVQVGDADVELDVATPTAFRLSVSYDGRTTPIDSTFLVKSSTPDWHFVQSGNFVGLKSKAGELDINPQTGEWLLKNAKGATLIPPSPLAKSSQTTADKSTGSGIDLPVTWTSGAPVEVYGCGNGVASLQQTGARAQVGNGKAVIPYYWTTNGYAALAVTENDNAPASWTAASDSSSLIWHFPGKSADLYLMSAASLTAAALAYDQLTGFPPVPPRWTFGYLQSRWGWKDRAYIEDTMHQFQTRHIPVDAFIYDFEWYTPHPDYEVPPQGEQDFSDFGWNPALFPDPASQIAAYDAQGVRFVGIRKPRIGNSETLKLMRQNGWLLDAPSGQQYQSRDLKFANADLRTWYANQSQPLLKNHISGWWNDEGEGAYNTYYYWNEAETQAFAQAGLDQRLWTINRAFSPGLQRLGAAAWTGDIEASWAMLGRAPTDLLNWGLAGMPYGACDIGGFWNQTTPELLSRWMEAGVFFPIMRTHSELNMVPHFPWLFGPAALDAITKAIDLRYRFIPYDYSLAYQAHETGVPLMRPLTMEFPGDPKVANLSDQWMMGSSVMAAPILQQTNSRSIYLPKDRWFRFNTSTTLEGGQTIDVTAGLDEIPIYVRAGTILPLGPVVQNTEQLPGGPLEVQVYPGKNASFVLTEDDGESTAYLKGAFRHTTFRWNDTSRKLSWSVKGNYSGPYCFQKITASLFDPQQAGGKKQLEANLDSSGSLTFPR
jgi:alpha-glucosidase